GGTKDRGGRFPGGQLNQEAGGARGGGGGWRAGLRAGGGQDPRPPRRGAGSRVRAARRGKRPAVLSEPAVDAVPLRFGNPTLFRELLGQHDEHVKLLERELGVRIDVGDGVLTVHGDPVESELASRSLTQLYGLLEQGYPIYAPAVEYALPS